MDGRRKSDNKLMMVSKIEEPPSPLLRMFLQHKKSTKKRDPHLKAKEMTKDDERRKDLNGIWSKLGGTISYISKILAKKGYKENRSPD